MLGFVIVILLLVLVFGFSIFFGVFRFVANILSAIFSFGKRPASTRPKTTTTPKKEKKNTVLFNKDAVEDADFEEIKD